MVEFDECPDAFATPGDIDPQEYTLRGIETESQSVGSLEIIQIEVIAIGENLACISKERHIQSYPGFPPVFGIENHLIPVSEPKLAKAAQVVRTSKRLLKVKRRTMTGTGTIPGSMKPKHRYPVAFIERHVLLHLGFDPSKIEFIELPVVIVRNSSAIVTAAVRITGGIPRIRGSEEFPFEKVRLAVQARRVRVGKDLFR
jgi:hypothetical protein